ncbi:MAG: glycosyltransferase family 4 protein [Arenicellales bacterium]
MKYFYATSARVPGIKAHCSQIAQMCRSFQNAGVDIELLHPNRAKLPVYESKSIKEWYGFDQDVPVQALNCVDLLSRLPAGLPGIIYQLAFNLMTGTFNRSLIKYIKQYQGEFVFYTRDLRVFPKLAESFPEVKKIMEFHHLEESPGSTYDAESKIISAATGIVVLTSPMKEMLVERGYSPEKVLVESSAVDPETFPGGITSGDARARLKLSEQGKIVAYIGNFHTLGLEKGLDTIVQSIPMVTREYQDVSFYFVGGPMDYAASYISSLQDSGVDSRHYNFFDRQAYKDIYLWLAAADVLVMPLPDHPRFSKNTSPMKIFEYMTSGRPMVISDLPAFRDVLKHEHNALMVPSNNTAAFAEAVLRLLQDSRLAGELAKNARNDVQHSTWDERAKRITQWIEALG